MNLEDKKKFLEDYLKVRRKLEEKFSEKFGPEPHVSIKAPNLDSLYFKAIDAALKYGRLNIVDSGSFKGEYRIEFDNATLIVTDPTTRPLAPIPREGIPVTTNPEKIEKYFREYLIGKNLEENEHYRYCAWIGGLDENISLVHNGVPRGTRLNQLEWCANHFVNEGLGNNHCYITVGCAEGLQRYDWKGEDDASKGSTECLRGLSLKIKENKLNLNCFFRSWDLVAGTPENLGGFVLLMEYVCDMINTLAYSLNKNLPIVTPGVLCGHSDGLHIYEHNLDLAKLWVGLDK